MAKCFILENGNIISQKKKPMNNFRGSETSKVFPRNIYSLK
jgi:hypothetical protein